MSVRMTDIIASTRRSPGNLFSRHDRPSFIGEEFVVDLFIVHRFDDTDADRMMNHQARKQVAINKNSAAVVDDVEKDIAGIMGVERNQ